MDTGYSKHYLQNRFGTVSMSAEEQSGTSISTKDLFRLRMNGLWEGSYWNECCVPILPGFTSLAKVWVCAVANFPIKLPKERVHAYTRETGPNSSIGRVSAPGNGRSLVRSRAVTYQS